MLVPGEFVVNKESAEKNANLLQTINNSSTSINNNYTQAMKDGGIVNKETAEKNASLLQTINNNTYTQALKDGGVINKNYLNTLPTHHLDSGGLVRETASNLSSVTNNNTTQGDNISNVYITIEGNLVDNIDWVENNLIPTINEAVLKGHRLENN